MILTLTIIHLVISVVLIVVVLMQHGKQQGLSGAIAGGAETFFGKNKGRTIDAMLKKFTAVIAALFIISSLVLFAVSMNEYKGQQTEATETTETAENAEAPTSDAAQNAPQVQMDENGNLVDAEGNVVATTNENGDLVDTEGNVLATKDQMSQAAEGAASEEAPAGETAEEEAPEAETAAEEQAAE